MVLDEFYFVEKHLLESNWSIFLIPENIQKWDKISIIFYVHCGAKDKWLLNVLIPYLGADKPDICENYLKKCFFGEQDLIVVLDGFISFRLFF